MSDDGTLDSREEDTEWCEESYARCASCHFSATVAYFTTPRTVLDDIADVV
jgi:hypothetical protein